MDLFFIPVCSIARAFGYYRLADRIFRMGPHLIATELGTCSYYYELSPEEKAADEKKQRRIQKELDNEENRKKDCIKRLEAAGYTKQGIRQKGRSYRYPWVWVAPEGHKPTKKERVWLNYSEHSLKDDFKESWDEYDFD